MIDNIKNLKYYSQKYNVPDTDTCLISLNTLGAKSSLKFLRIRSYFTPNFINKTFYLMICLNTSQTPFYLTKSKIHLGEYMIGSLKKFENDLVELYYFRKKKKVLVLNTNDRSHCIGKCTFCGTQYQTPRSKRKFLEFKEILKLFEKIEETAKIKFSKLEEICLNTGLFENEKKLFTHLISIYKAASLMNFKGEIKYIGAQLRNKSNLKEISKIIPKFSYYFTLETLERRDFIDKRKKYFAAFNVEKTVKFLNNLRKKGIETSLLYVLGLDSLSSISHAFQKFKKVLTRFPVINIFQAYHPSFELLRHEDAKRLDYFLNARMIFENIFEDTDLRPKLWENYRGLWYTKFKGEKIEGSHLQTFIRGY